MSRSQGLPGHLLVCTEARYPNVYECGVVKLLSRGAWSSQPRSYQDYEAPRNSLEGHSLSRDLETPRKQTGWVGPS